MKKSLHNIIKKYIMNIHKITDHMTRNKIFIIGFNKTGTRTLHKYFAWNGIMSIHHSRGLLARTIHKNRNKRNMLGKFCIFKVYSDMEDVTEQNYAHVTYFKKLDRKYPDSKFILNIRNVDNWINSRNNHGTYTQRCCKILNLTKEEINKKWRNDFYNHKNNVIKYFSDKPNKLLIFDIEKDSVQKINDFFPELQLNSKFYKHVGKTSK